MELKPKKRIRNRKKRIDIIKELRGGCCEYCGYARCKSALVFHHVLQADKSFGIARNRDASIESIIKEVNKCALLCSVHHSECHENLIDISNIKTKTITVQDYLDFVDKNKSTKK